MKITTIAASIALLSSAFTATSAMANIEGLSANIGATSNYLWRGMEQTSGSSAISGGIDYEASSGFYAGSWVSSADWAEDMTYELDLYGGYAGEINSNLSYDVGFIYYAYPDSKDDVDFSEVYGSLSFSGLTVGVAVLADGEDADAGDSVYSSIDYAVEVSEGLELALHAGYYSGDFVGNEDLTDLGISLSKSGFTMGVSHSDLDDADDAKVYVSYAIDIDL